MNGFDGEGGAAGTDPPNERKRCSEGGTAIKLNLMILSMSAENSMDTMAGSFLYPCRRDRSKKEGQKGKQEGQTGGSTCEMEDKRTANRGNRVQENHPRIALGPHEGNHAMGVHGVGDGKDYEMNPI